MDRAVDRAEFLKRSAVGTAALALAAFAPRAAGAREVRPNVVLIKTDDQDAASLSLVPDIEGLLGASGGAGVTFSKMFVTTPLCCVSRASVFTGLYGHNHRVRGNSYPAGGVQRYREEGWEKNNVVRDLKAAGYRCSHVGKYINGYVGGYVPPHWDRFFATASAYVNNDGTGIKFYRNLSDGSREGESVAVTNLDTYAIFDEAEEEVARWSDAPAFLSIGLHAPHRPSHYDTADEGAFADIKVPRSGNYGKSDADDPRWVRNKAPWTEEEARNADEAYRRRARSLLAVERRLRRFLGLLPQNTYVFFTSDNGFHLGDHGLGPNKHTPYEEDVRVPLFVRGPDLAAGSVVARLTANIDLAPTFLELAGTSNSARQDGRSLVPLLRGEQVRWRKRLLLEHWRADSAFPTYRAVRSGRMVYIEYDGGERELYDLKVDPEQMDNLIGEGVPHRGLRSALYNLKGCSGAACRAAESTR